MMQGQECWICLDDSTPDQMRSLCKCPNRPAHDTCWAKWCLIRAGTREETACRFCGATLPDYRETLRRGHPSIRSAPTLYANVSHRGRSYQVALRSKAQFERDVKKALRLDDDAVIGADFTVPDPTVDPCCSSSGGEDSGRLKLSGFDTFEAVVFCAELAAAKQEAASSSQGAPTTPPPKLKKAHRERECSSSRPGSNDGTPASGASAGRGSRGSSNSASGSARSLNSDLLPMITSPQPRTRKTRLFSLFCCAASTLDKVDEPDSDRLMSQAAS